MAVNLVPRMAVTLVHSPVGQDARAVGQVLDGVGELDGGLAARPIVEEEQVGEGVAEVHGGAAGEGETARVDGKVHRAMERRGDRVADQFAQPVVAVELKKSH